MSDEAPVPGTGEGVDQPSVGETPEGSGRYGPAAVATVTAALATWPIAFNFGAYRVVFYSDMFQFVVGATVGFAITMVRSPYQGRVNWFTRMALGAPALWMALSVSFFDSLAAAASDPLFGLLGLVIAVVAVPTVLKLLVDLFTPELSSAENSYTLGFAIAVIIVVAAAGYVVGRNNDAFLTCDDFKVAGADQPPNCAAQ